jgi:hypothetical protein
MAAQSFNELSDATVAAPLSFSELSDAVIVPPNSFELFSDALVLPASAFALTSDAMICLSPVCNRTPIDPPTEPLPEFPKAPVVNPFACQKFIKPCNITL